jgi:hypothetical protein
MVIEGNDLLGLHGNHYLQLPWLHKYLHVKIKLLLLLVLLDSNHILKILFLMFCLW